MKESGLVTQKGVALFEYDFAKHGGAVGDIVVDPKLIPKGAVITSGVIHVLTALTSGGAATIAAKVTGANDILAATAVASFSLGALLDVVPVGTAATMVKAAAYKDLTLTVAAFALTAGKMTIALEYMITNPA